MKKIILTQLLLLGTMVVLAQKTKIPPSWGHYKKPAAYSTQPVRGMEGFKQSLFFHHKK